MGHASSFFSNSFVLPVYDIIRRTSRFKLGRVLQKTQWLSYEETKRLQTKNLRVMLNHAYDTVPYYRRKFRERNLLPSDIKNIDDLPKLPILTKADIRKNIGDLISRTFPRRNMVPYASGGTGNPIKFYITKEQFSWEVAAEYRAYGWAGYKFGDRCFMLWGSPSDLSKYKGLFSHFTKFLEGVYIADTYVMSEEALARFVYLLGKFDPEIVRGYANSVYMVAKYMKKRSIGFVRPRAVITSAETLSDVMRKTIEEAFDCPVFDFYGSREIGALASECEEHSGYHISAENVVMEFTKENEQVSTGEDGLILLTSLRNFGMPFIRYKNEDVGKPSDEACHCGRGLPMMSSIEGRVSQFMAIYDKQLNRVIPVRPESPGVISIALMQVPLKCYRVIQESLDRVVVKAVKDKGYSQKDTDFLVEHVRKYFGSNVAIEVEFVDSLPPLPSGKRSNFISKINAFEQ